MLDPKHAILAVLVTITLTGAQDPPQDPIRVRFRMADGVRVDGTLTDWDAHGIDGSFGLRQWTELDARDVWALYRKLMDLDDATHWVALGRVLLLCSLDQPAAEKNADRSFARATWLDPEVKEAIAVAREEVAMAREARDAAARDAEAQRLATQTPEARDWRAEPWPQLEPAEQNAAVLSMRADAAEFLGRVGMDFAPVETEFFLFYSDMSRGESAKWARELDRMYERVAEIFALEDGKNLFWGKAVIFVFRDQQRFQEFESKAFRQLVADAVGGMFHPLGPKVFVSFFRQPDDLDFAGVLVHETVHGFLHRYRTPRRLPTWANEGFSDYVAAVSFRNSPVDRGRRQYALKFIRDGGNVNSVLNLDYGSGWPGPDGIAYPVSYLLVRLMIQDRPRQFGDWVNAIKSGKDWQQALIDEFGVDRSALTDRFTRFHMVND